MSTLVPVGSTITRIYFTVRPYSGAVYSVGEHETFVSARDAAIAHFTREQAKFENLGRTLGMYERPVIVERWVLAHPYVGGSQGRTDMQIGHETLTDGMIHAAKREIS